MNKLLNNEKLQIKHAIRQWLPAYRTYMLIETGSHEGNGIESAFAYGFKRVRSVEYHDMYYTMCKAVFQEQIEANNLQLYYGKSVDMLPEMLKDINKQVTFWLDAHVYGDCPVLEELEVIKQHPVKNHIILIDDYQSFGTQAFGNITIEQVRAKILEINPRYKFYREDTGTPGAVLVAIV